MAKLIGYRRVQVAVHWPSDGFARLHGLQLAVAQLGFLMFYIAILLTAVVGELICLRDRRLLAATQSRHAE